MSEHTEESTFEIVEREYTPEAAQEISPAEVVTIIEHDQAAIDIAKVVEHMQTLKADYTRRIAEIEVFMGFAISSEDLAVRMARIEKFVGIGG